MKISTFLSANQPWVRHNADTTHLSRSLARLSSGLRINSAADDASGLSISTKMGAQIRGLNRSVQNITDSIGWVQTTEGALQEVSALLQRGRELSVQAVNDTLTMDDRQNIQQEIGQILAEVQRIATTSEYNTMKVFDDSPVVRGNDLERRIIDNLKRSWLAQGEKLVKDLFGLEADGASIEIVFDNDPSPGAFNAAVSFISVAGRSENMQLRINLAQWTDTNWPDGDLGGSPGNYQDRVIAHEMVHAIMGRNMDMTALPSWFKEGAAEFIHGADERLASVLASSSAAAVVADVADGTWSSDSLHYAGAYAAVRYLHAEAKAKDGATGFREILGDIKGGMTLDQAIANRTAHADEAAFRAAFAANGAAFIGTMDLTNTDTGAIGGLDADGGSIKTAQSVVPDLDGYSNDPLLRFAESFPSYGSGLAGTMSPMRFQIGAGAGETLDVSRVNVTIGALGIADLDVSRSASMAITKFDEAIQLVARERSRLGAAQNRLQHALSVNQINSESTAASNSRIQDADIAQEMVGLTRNQILNQASTALLAQAGGLAQGSYQALLRLIA